MQQLLTLARQEPGAGATNPVGRLELAVLAREAVIEHAKLAEARGIDLGLAEADAAAVVSGDADGLRILLANLLTNAALDPFGKIPEFKYCAVRVAPV